MARKNKTDIAILECLKEKGPQNFTELRKNTGIRGKDNFLTSLRNLRKGSLIEKDIDTRKYYVTDIGKTLLQNEQLRELALNNKTSVKYDVILSEINQYTMAYPPEKIYQYLFAKPDSPLVASKREKPTFMSERDRGKLEKLRKRIQAQLEMERKSFAYGREKQFGSTFYYNVRMPFPDLSLNLPLEMSLITNKEVDAKKLFTRAQATSWQTDIARAMLTVNASS